MTFVFCLGGKIREQKGTISRDRIKNPKTYTTTLSFSHKGISRSGEIALMTIVLKKSNNFMSFIEISNESSGINQKSYFLIFKENILVLYFSA